MADIRLPPTLPPLFAGLSRRVESDAPTVRALMDDLEARWPGLRDRLCEPGPVIRRHIHVFVDGRPADLTTAIPGGSRVDIITAISGG